MEMTSHEVVLVARAEPGRGRARRRAFGGRVAPGSTRPTATARGSSRPSSPPISSSHARRRRDARPCRPADGEIEMIAIDRGPGMPNLGAQHDRRAFDRRHSGHRTRRHPAAGRRLRHLSRPSRHGTVTWTRLRRRRSRRRSRRGFDVGGDLGRQGARRCAATPGQCAIVRTSMTTAMVDGLGHGLYAAEASRAAVDAFNSAGVRQLRRGHRDDARSACATPAAPPAPSSRSAGRRRSCVSPGSATSRRPSVTSSGPARGFAQRDAGHDARPFREYTYPWIRDALLVMHSDGLASQLVARPIPGSRGAIRRSSPRVLYRDFSRERDDVTVLVGREAA